LAERHLSGESDFEKEGKLDKGLADEARSNAKEVSAAYTVLSQTRD